MCLGLEQNGANGASECVMGPYCVRYNGIERKCVKLLSTYARSMNGYCQLVSHNLFSVYCPSGIKNIYIFSKINFFFF
jgi:hypothetical protein